MRRLCNVELGERRMGVLRRVFDAHGQLCASRPWEVIIATLTVILGTTSLSLFAASNKICDWNYRCERSSHGDLDADTKSSDVVILTITRCIAVVYFYLQFSSLRKLGSKYLLGIAGLFTVFSSFVFSVGVINFFGTDLTGLNEALPFFLLLVDLSKACTLAKFALSATSQEEVVVNVGRGMAVLGPMLTLDALVETLVIGVGTLSGVKVLQTMCCFGCLSVVTNYLAFMTFYPACLALSFELSRGSRPMLQIQQLAKAWQLTEEEEKPNPVTQRIKIVMSAGLVVVHAHSRLVSVTDDSSAAAVVSPRLDNVIQPDMPFWLFCLHQMASLSVDYILTLVLAVLLAVKYVLFDHDNHDSQSSQDEAVVMATVPASSAAAAGELNVVKSSFGGGQLEPIDEVADEVLHSETTEDLTPTGSSLAANTLPASSACEMVSVETQTESDSPPQMKSTKFYVGDSSSEDNDSDVDVDMSTTSTVETQTEDSLTAENQLPTEPRPPRPVDVCVAILNSVDGASSLTDDEVMLLVDAKHIPAYKLEKQLDNYERGVAIRRRLVAKSLPDATMIDKLPYTNFDYSYVYGSCCENVIGYMPVPVGVVGPLLLDGQTFTVPMATTEGCLLASTNRGCRALTMCGNAVSVVSNDGMSRAPVVRFSRASRAHEAKVWLEDDDNYKLIMDAFSSTSRFARVLGLQIKQVARSLHLRFTAFTGDAMGMNMVSKGCEQALRVLQEHFPDMQILSLSGNFCTDKKSSAVNWVEGRGKSVICDAVIPSHVVQQVLKTSASAMADLNVEKNLMGSAVAGSIGGFNAHAANVVTAIYIATGQDPAQNVCSSQCLTVMEVTGVTHDDLYVSCTMPCVEVGTIGGGTVLPAQSACLQMLGVKGSSVERPGVNSQTLARVVCATVMAAELSLMSALTTGDLVRSHLTHNRSVLNMAPSSPVLHVNSVPPSSLLRHAQSYASCLKV